MSQAIDEFSLRHLVSCCLLSLFHICKYIKIFFCVPMPTDTHKKICISIPLEQHIQKRPHRSDMRRARRWIYLWRTKSQINRYHISRPLPYFTRREAQHTNSSYLCTAPVLCACSVYICICVVEVLGKYCEIESWLHTICASASMCIQNIVKHRAGCFCYEVGQHI